MREQDPLALARAIGAALLRRGGWIAVAESCTGGGVMEALTEVPGSSRYLLGGIVAYADHIKVGQLGVSADLLTVHGAVSAEVAHAMAQGVRSAWSVDFGLAVTGIAGPSGGTPGKPVGTVWLAVAGPERVVVKCERFDGDRTTVRQCAIAGALRLLLEEIESPASSFRVKADLSGPNP